MKFLRRILLPLLCVSGALGSLGDSVIIIGPISPVDPGQPILPPTLAAPADGDYGGRGPAAVAVGTLTNPAYPSAGGQTMTVSVYHPVGSGDPDAVDPTLPTIFFAHAYPYGEWGPINDWGTWTIGQDKIYRGLLTNLASRGYNVVFSPYEAATETSDVSDAQRFDELVSGWEAAVAAYGLNTAQVGFVGHSYGAGLLPAAIRHETMGLADAYRAGNQWGGTAAFLYSIAPSYALDGGGQTGVGGAQAIALPANLNVVVQVFYSDFCIADPALALDVFYNVTVPYAQKNFLTVRPSLYGDASDFLPLDGDADPSRAWTILRPLDALAAYTFTGDATAHTLALGGGVAQQTYTGTWSDGSPNPPNGATDHPAYAPDPQGFYQWSWHDPNNPREGYPLVSNTPFFDGAVPVADGVYYLAFANGNPFGYFSYLDDFHYVYHDDLGWEYWFDAADGQSGVYLYDFASQGFFYTSPTFPFPYLYDFSQDAVLYYYPAAGSPDRYTSGPRYFYNFATGQIITR